MSRTPISFTSGCAINAGSFYLSANIDEYDVWDAFTKILVYKHNEVTKWQELDLDGWNISSVTCQKNNNHSAVVCLDKEGDVGIFQENHNELQNIREKNENQIYGQFNQIRVINDKLYACGSGGQIYKSNQNKWEPVGHDFEEQPLNVSTGDLSFLDYDIDFGFEKYLYDVNGFDENNIYVCGTKNESGFIAFFDGSLWTVIERLTPSSLSSITLCSDNKNILITGDYGTLLKGNFKDGFKNLKNISINSNFYNCVYYKNFIYIASEDGLYRYSDEKFSLVEELLDIVGVIYVEEKEGILWILSYKKLIRYNGDLWERIDYLDDYISESINSIKSGKVCPKSGYWYTFAKENSRQYFNQGDVFPNVKSDWGDVYWQYDGEK
jgi:hypothetical protein